MKVCPKVKIEAPYGLNLISDQQLTRLTRLTYLFLKPYTLHKVTNAALLSLKCLNHLNLRKNNWIEDEHLLNLTSVTKLNLAQTANITNAAILNLPNLKVLILYRNNLITDAGIQHLTNLRCLFLAQNKGITDAGIQPLTALTHLILRSCDHITDLGLQPLTNLVELKFESLKITSQSIMRLKNLTSLDFEGTRINDEVLSLPLKHLAIKHTIITAKGIGEMKYLRELTLRYNHNKIINDDFKNFAFLTKLTVNRDDKITDEGLGSLIALRDLKIYRNSKIDGNCFRFLSDLTSLTIFWSSVGDINMKYLSKLERISVNSCRYITDAGINVLSNLKYAYLSDAYEGFVNRKVIYSFSDAALIPLMKLRRVHLTIKNNIFDWDMILYKRGVKIIRNSNFITETVF
ncbi:MAG: hypothetical protein Hyperionvirus5_46 [Hyperionvirus sp.]|uniref:Leucine-rich repeat protein n=1 Tax=Hyperionvirus sp. TaxID=2487770 RepID=A0A3G5A7I9_9VIRU|nr:MAG: hypothetical protein Hyperionvirus5_46 [Hyperionvirus sp.]